jgi:omega-6 fatty acid desaturase (delta-12 desaturase)
VPRRQRQTPRPDAPAPVALAHLRPDARLGFGIVACATTSTAGALWLSIGGGWTAWAVGQVWLAAAFVQWFVLLHECGHGTLFRGRRVHALVGHVAAFFSLIPYHCWKRVHGRHHKWTGWQDLDPTTEPLVPCERGRLERALVNVCWRCWVPLFAIVYRLNNFWNIPRLFGQFRGAPDRRAILRDVAMLAAAYTVIAWAVGPAMLFRWTGVALVVSLVIEELLILSQHTHVPQGVSGGALVDPYPSIEQEPFTRSLRLPSWASSLVLHFDAHELHHMYPFVPGYHLRRIPYRTDHEVGWWSWVAGAKRLKGEVLLFENRDQSGWEL